MQIIPFFPMYFLGHRIHNVEKCLKLRCMSEKGVNLNNNSHMVKNFHYKNNHPSNRTDLQFPPPPRVLVVATISSVGMIRGVIE
jgi:hypothetical protein